MLRRVAESTPLPNSETARLGVAGTPVAGETTCAFTAIKARQARLVSKRVNWRMIGSV